MTHAVRSIHITRAALLSLSLAAAAFTLFNFTTPHASARQGATAQPSATPSNYLVRITHVKPGMDDAYRALQRNEVLPALKKGGGKEHHVWTTATYGTGFEYVSIEPSPGMANLDAPGALTKALGEERAHALALKWGQLVTDTRRFNLQLRPELCIPLKNNGQFKLAVVYHSHIAPGRRTEYEELFKSVTLPWLRKSAQQGYLMGRVGSGGDSYEYIGMFPLDSFADISKWQASFAQAGSGPAGKEAGLVLAQESAIYRYVPELSFRAEAQKAGQ